MENTINLTKRNIYSFVNSLKYGINSLSIDKAIKRDEFFNILETYNLACSAEIMRFRQLGNEFENDIFEIIVTERDYVFPVLNEHDFLLDSLAKFAFRGKNIYNLSINPVMIKHAFKIGKRNGVKFIQNGDEYMFSGLSKEKPVSTQITDAYFRGDTNIRFELNKHVATTLRCYASNIGSIHGKKFRCSVGNGVMTIWFKEPNPKDAFEEEIKTVIERFTDKLTKDQIHDVLASQIYKLSGHKFIPLLDKENLEDVEDLDYEDDYEDEPVERDYEAEAAEFLANNPNLDINGQTREVDGMQQYNIAALEEKIEDDDF